MNKQILIKRKIGRKNIIVTTKVNDSQKDPKDVGNDKNNNTHCFVLLCIILL